MLAMIIVEASYTRSRSCSWHADSSGDIHSGSAQVQVTAVCTACLQNGDATFVHVL